ncbi:(2Fe-2S)-binding protein [Gluconobacter cerinus]|nr:(2Fe-2S)-binding protein [Gluconobacter cerinus]
MFAALGAVPDAITLFLDDQPIIARQGDTVAVCILRTGVPYNRLNPVSGAPRLPYCMIGHCFECLVEIDGIANQQACLTVARDGMKIRRQLGAPLALKHPEA